MARSTPPLLRLRQRLATYRWRRVGVLAASSLALSLTLVWYLFGIDGQFFSRLLCAFLVSFWLLIITFLAAIPFIGWAATHWFGPSWSGEARVAPRQRPTTAKPATRPPAARRSSITII